MYMQNIMTSKDIIGGKEDHPANDEGQTTELKNTKCRFWKVVRGFVYH